MTEPIFILGCHRSGTSAVAGLLVHACGVQTGELMPATPDNPLGYFEAIGVVEAHRHIFGQMERDWTCPPSTIEPEHLDLTALREQVELHRALPGVWAMKDPRSMFLFPAWSHLGVDRVRLVGVVRPPADTVKSIEKRDFIRQDRAEAIVDVHLRRLAEIAEQVPLPVIHFPGDGDSLVGQVRDLAASLDLPWDDAAARQFFDHALVRNRSPLHDSSPAFDLLLERAQSPETLPAVSLSSLKLRSEPEWPLPTHLGPRFGQQRNHLWNFARFSADPGSTTVVEVVPEGARRSRRSPLGGRLVRIEVTTPGSVGATLARSGERPACLILHGLLAGLDPDEVSFVFRSLYITTDTFAEVVVDVPDPEGAGILSSSPAPVDEPRPASVERLAAESGWDLLGSERLSPGRTGMMFRKRVLVDHELVPVVADLISSLAHIKSVEQRLTGFESGHTTTIEPTWHGADVDVAAAVAKERKRADAAELAYKRLLNRRGVRFALALARPSRGIFRTVRAWKNGR